MSSTFMFEMHEASRTRRRARVATFGPSSSGKTYTAFVIARGLCKALGMPEAPFVVLDAERGRSELYANKEEFAPYQTIPLIAPFSPDHYIAGVRFAERKIKERGFAPVLVIDGISPEWNMEGGIQQIVDEAVARMGGNKWGAWAVATPMHQRFIDTILQSDLHVICTMRSKTEWGKDEKNRPIKIGLGPVQREDLEYEFDLVLRMDMTNTAEVVKTFLDELPLGMQMTKPGDELADPIFKWLNEGGDKAPEPGKAEEETAPVPEGEQATLPEAAAAENGGEKAKPATKGTITKLINQLDAEHADYEKLVFPDEAGGEPIKHPWLSLVEQRCREWFECDLDDLTEETGQAMIERLRYTKEQLDEAKAAEAARASEQLL